jgi:hypothetical protein
MKHGPGVVSAEWKDRMARSSNPHRNADAWKMLGAQQKTTVQQWAKDDEARATAAAEQRKADQVRLGQLNKLMMSKDGLTDAQAVCMTQLFNKSVPILVTDDSVSLRRSLTGL